MNVTCEQNCSSGLTGQSKWNPYFKISNVKCWLPLEYHYFIKH